MMFRTLYSRLALTLFLLLSAVGMVLILLVVHSSTQYEQEVAQKLNRTLATHIVEEYPLIQNRVVNQDALDELFHQLMIINPAIELYLLDREGTVLAWSAPAGKVKRKQVELAPIQSFLEGENRFPLKGDDPRDPDGTKVFSAAQIGSDDDLQGYLYVVLGGEQYDDVVQMLGRSYILDSALIFLLVALAATLLGGLLVFAWLTRRLRRLAAAMRRYAETRSESATEVTQTAPDKAKDEVDLLNHQFREMATRIDAQIEELKRMDGLRREMVANVSHDLRTPLTTMRGYLETLLLKNDDLTAEQKRYLETALRYSRRLGTLVDELFELARLDSCETVVYSEPFSMSELVQDVTQQFELRAREQKVQLEASLKPDVPPVYGDIAMMQRVLENLLENALRHTPAGGRIRIRVDVDSGTVVVEVTDSGSGIAEEDVPMIFERFYQPKGEHEGGTNSGLGLAIVKRILELHGSMIRVHSERNRGTTFTFQMAPRPSR